MINHVTQNKTFTIFTIIGERLCRQFVTKEQISILLCGFRLLRKLFSCLAEYRAKNGSLYHIEAEIDLAVLLLYLDPITMQI